VGNAMKPQVISILIYLDFVGKNDRIACSYGIIHRIFGNN
jgi:hypothetical protein